MYLYKSKKLKIKTIEEEREQLMEDKEYQKTL
jgi:hypothetical protein